MTSSDSSASVSSLFTADSVGLETSHTLIESRQRAAAESDDATGDYDDEDFEEYSDEFEADDDDDGTDDRREDASLVAEPIVAWAHGKRVEVFWEDENSWFPGTVIDDRKPLQRLIEYDDGDVGWEVH
ncbi:hypothetical protein PINS_up008057 [Pythium insidiosum]|nr:hypothetical protein PINS_up008057 [Pythium insidiosum]